MARLNPALADLIEGNSSSEIMKSGGLIAFPDFEARFERFLRDHGHREVDFDAYVATWCEAPWIVLDNVRLILGTPMDRRPAEQERELKIRAQQAEVKLFAEDEVPWPEIAFATVRNTLTHYFDDRRRGSYGMHIGTIEPPVRAPAS